MDAFTFISFMASLATVVVAIFSILKSKNNDVKNTGEKDGSISTNIQYIKERIDEVNRKQENLNKNYTDLLINMAKLEQSDRQAHQKIDELKCKLEVKHESY